MISQQVEQQQLDKSKQIKLNLIDSLFTNAATKNQPINPQQDAQCELMQEICSYGNQMWKILPKIGQIVGKIVTAQKLLEMGNYRLEGSVHFVNMEQIYIGQNVCIEHGALIQGPTYIGSNVTIRKGAYIRGNAYIGHDCLIGNSVEIKNSILFPACQIAHFNYIGDSILGRKAHFSAGSITSNYKLDGSVINVKIDEKIIKTELNKFGALVGENVQIGCNAVLNPGSVICKNSVVYPLVNFRGFLGEGKIMKIVQETQVVDRK